MPCIGGVQVKNWDIDNREDDEEDHECLNGLKVERSSSAKFELAITQSFRLIDIFI